eukprot:7141450-Ditylum_brightwellii.AAC.1
MENRDEFCHLLITAIHDALHITMTMNIFTISDSHWLQETRAAIGMPPAPTYAQTTFGAHEIKMIIRFIFSLLLYKRYIDDIIGVWVPRDDPATDDVEWRTFKTLLNMCFDLEWTVIESNNTVDFMDLTITLKEGKITTTLFEKSLNLYLYILPHSAHPP